MKTGQGAAHASEGESGVISESRNTLVCTPINSEGKSIRLARFAGFGPNPLPRARCPGGSYNENYAAT